MKLLLIGSFGFAGALARYGVDSFVKSRAPGAFPWGTFVVNASGCLLLGLLFAVTVERAALSPAVRAGITVGFLGTYTTFSTFALETVRLMESRALGLAFANIALSVIIGLLFVFAGLKIGRALT